ncbi:MAG: hypothetical protein R3E02_10585 [Blastomonas sp.]
MSGLTLGDVGTGQKLPELVYRVTATRLVAGALASRDYSPLHHDRNYAVNVANQRDIFANTQFQSALFERYLQDWGGPLCRIARLKFRMRSSVYADDEARLTGTVTSSGAALPCGAGAVIAVELHVEDRLATSCEALVGLPCDAGDNPWNRRGPEWLQP